MLWYRGNLGHINWETYHCFYTLTLWGSSPFLTPERRHFSDFEQPSTRVYKENVDKIGADTGSNLANVSLSRSTTGDCRVCGFPILHAAFARDSMWYIPYFIIIEQKFWEKVVGSRARQLSHPISCALCVSQHSHLLIARPDNRYIASSVVRRKEVLRGNFTHLCGMFICKTITQVELFDIQVAYLWGLLSMKVEKCE